jgi:hypothetical protein
MISLLAFCLAVYGLTFLLADARIFGCDAKLWHSGPSPEDTCSNIGIFKIRQRFLKYGFFADLLVCYFCVGCWAGLGMHFVFARLFETRYFLASASVSTVDSVLTAMTATVIGGAAAFIIDTAISSLEK